MSVQENIKSNLLGIQYIYATYLHNLPNIAPYQTESDTLALELSEVNRKLQELDRVEEVYDREFLDRKKNPTSFGLFSRYGLQTTQDWVLAYFFLSYVFFSVIFFITLLMNARNMLKASIFAFCVVGTIGALITTMITRYA